METALETSGEDSKLHSKQVEKIRNYTRNEWRRVEITLETSGEDRVFDLNGDGTIERSELEKVLASGEISDIVKAEIDDIIKEVVQYDSRFQ